jgi:hypothetical protein
MEYDSVPAVFGLNKFLWDRIEKATILDKANYGGLIPIVPSQEVAALRQAIDEAPGVGSHGFIVYSWYTNGYAQNWFQPIDTVIYRINATNGKELRALILLIIDTFKRYDESAEAVNAFIQGSNLNDEFKAYDYKSVYTAAAQASQPTALEDEPMEATVTVRVAYAHDRDNHSL